MSALPKNDDGGNDLAPTGAFRGRNNRGPGRVNGAERIRWQDELAKVKPSDYRDEFPAFVEESGWWVLGKALLWTLACLALMIFLAFGIAVALFMPAEVLWAWVVSLLEYL